MPKHKRQRSSLSRTKSPEQKANRTPETTPDNSQYARVAAVLDLIHVSAMMQTETPETKEDIAKLLDKTIDAVLELYRAQGIEIPKPTFIYRDQPCAFDDSITARVNNKEELSEQIMAFLAPLLNRQLYRTLGINLSQEAAEEITAKNQESKKELRKKHEQELEPETDADIIFYPASIDGAVDLKLIVTHELWHLIEKQHGYGRNDLTHEGTAQFATRHLLDLPQKQDQRKIHTFADVIYTMGYSKVADSLQSSSNPLQDLLNPEYRAQLAEEFRNTIFPYIRELIEKAPFDLGQARQMAHFALVNDPDYADFVVEPTLENMLATSRKKGYNKLAEELEAQDTTQLMKFYREAITLQ